MHSKSYILEKPKRLIIWNIRSIKWIATAQFVQYALWRASGSFTSGLGKGKGYLTLMTQVIQ